MASRMSLEDVKIVDEQTKDTVKGFIREIETILPDDDIYFTIPTLVIHCILLYFFHNEQFGTNNQNKDYCFLIKVNVLQRLKTHMKQYFYQ